MSALRVPRYLLGLRGTQLKNIAFMLGTPTTGRKPELQGHLTHRLNAPPSRIEFSRILSIDMGIKNLGICVLEAPHLAAEAGSHRGLLSPPLSVLSWQTVDVEKSMTPKTAIDAFDSDTSGVEQEDVQSMRRKATEPGLSVAAYTPANLAQAAHKLVTSLLVQHRPSTVLIERQRFRSGGMFGVQEWTIRVNLLEHMMWACLRTLSAEYPRWSTSERSELASSVGELEAVREMSPAKVARFWCSTGQQNLQDQVDDVHTEVHDTMRSGSRIEKADKIATAKAWVDQWKSGTYEDNGKVHLDFRGTAADTANVFGQRKPRKKKGDVESDAVQSIAKLDDLADCLLQGVAWVKWEENRRKLARMIAKDEALQRKRPA